MRSILDNNFDSAAVLRTGQVCLDYRLDPAQPALALLGTEIEFGMT